MTVLSGCILTAVSFSPFEVPQVLFRLGRWENLRTCRENQELRGTNELLKAASAFFASEPGPKR
ncbi:hypothetical protein FRC0190_00462 [Corynebacterium rouxii]|uniref:Transposase n=1 Tax=Corynebacterium rouxii TaxID=2719119 RepID=A0A6I8M9B0_9CORY|nr:hypothetical protein FRC0190_00462 [Corynebacterium rouxii]